MKMRLATQSAAIMLAIAAIVATSAPVGAQDAAATREPKGIVVALPPQPGTSTDARVVWAASGKMMLAALYGEYITTQGFLVTSQVGPMAHAWFIVDAASGKATPFLRARECRYLPDGRILALNYAPFDTPAEDIRKISLSPEREKNTKAAGIFSAAGEFLKDAPLAFGGTPSPDGKRFLDVLEPDGRNNYHCVRKLVVQAEEGEPIVLTPPIEAKPGRLVGFRQPEWNGSAAIRASVVDMDAREARRAPPGMWLNVTPTWHEYSLATRAWRQLAGEELKEMLARRVNVEGGAIYFMEDAIKLVRGGETKVLPWPELKDGDVDTYFSAFSPDGT